MKRDEAIVMWILGALVVLYFVHAYFSETSTPVETQVDPARSQLLGAAGVDPFENTGYTVEQMAAGTGL